MANLRIIMTRVHFGLKFIILIIVPSIYGHHPVDSGKAIKVSGSSTATNTSTDQLTATLTLIPYDVVAHFVNQSRIASCSFPDPDVKLKWRNPKNVIVSDTKGRVHIEEQLSGSLSLVFEFIVRADQGNWTCETNSIGVVLKKSFKMIVNEPISFRDTNPVQTAVEDMDATIRCEVRGHPEPSVSWDFNGKPLFPPNAKYTMLADGLLIKRVSKDDSGEYTCKAFQVSSSGSSFEEKSILLNIKHKPYFHKHRGYLWGNVTYGYVGGAVNLTCDAIAEPPATFTWSANNKKFSHKNHLIYSGQHVSMLQIVVKNSTVFGKYRCEAKNELGTISREIQLQEGTKPERPSRFELRGVNSDTLDIDVGATKSHDVDPDPSTIIGYRFELIPTEEYAKHRSWERAHRRDFDVEDGVTYLLVHLTPDTRYLIRVAARNAAGLSDWTVVKEFITHPLQPYGFHSGAAGPGTSAFLFLRLLTALGSLFLPTMVELKF
ncbi:neural cell adhesion molecule 2-like [Ochlerotatus camptorhynchus]|uniref:neural cell adhesion molecule 2-like n=1 Tax=Ochlerotatus camptorhynchus TaxID=644619 RepID=UPI0031DA4786